MRSRYYILMIGKQEISTSETMFDLIMERNRMTKKRRRKAKIVGDWKDCDTSTETKFKARTV